MIILGPNTSKEILKVSIPEEFEYDVYFVELQLNDSKDNSISDNFYWMAEDDDFTSLPTLPEVKLDVEVKKEEINKQIVYKLRLMNSSNNLAFFVNPSIRRGKRGEEVLPSFWSDNYFSILPGKTKTLMVEFQKSDLDGEEAYLKLDGWNIVSQRIRISY